MGSARAELARRVVDILAKGDCVPFRDAIQLRNWAIRPEDAMLSLEEIAHGILKQENPNEPEGSSRPMPSWFEFLRMEADIALTLIGVAGVHPSAANSVHALGNARKALAEIQRALLTPTARGLHEDEVLFLELRCTEIQLALEQDVD
jgi:hypothetical protein